ncbi:MAG: hypothetical protein LBP26_03735 [Clostridiales bacterium]|jgi:cyclic beta-1,2-glucan synthetase|nr:hypothetical protein [Clostridiales bacterium]
MQYLLLVFFISLAFLFFYKLAAPTVEPDFTLTGQLTDEKLRFAISDLAARSRVVKPRGKGLSTRLIRRCLNSAYKNIAARIAAGGECFEYENWIYDNNYKLTGRLNAIRREAHKFCFLPHSNDLPRVYEFASLLVKSCDGMITEELLSEAVRIYNRETPLSFAEITAIYPALEFAVLEYVAVFCAKSLKTARLAAKAKKDAAAGKISLPLLIYNSYTYALYKSGPPAVRRRVAALCLDNGLDAEARSDNFLASAARHNGRVRAAVTALHGFSTMFSDAYVITLSPVHEFLTESCGDPYTRTSLGTKYAYLRRINKTASAKKVGEHSVAREAVNGANAENKDVSFLILKKPAPPKAAYLYIAANLLVCAALTAASAFIFPSFGFLFALVCAPNLFVVGGAFLSAVSKIAFSRRELPSLDLKYADADKCRTLISVCRLVADAYEVADAFRNLETIICANGNEIFSYCLLLDLPSADSETDEAADAPVLKTCRELYEKSEYKDRLLILVRKRTRVKNGEKYQGWEKKRGAILQLNDYVSGGGDGAFALRLGNCRNEKYVITLDSDTLTNGAARLVELMEHPFNASVNIISVNMNPDRASANGTYFSRLYAGAGGLSSYAQYVACPENDIFGAGNYTGKGIYRVGGFQRILRNAFADETVLSHDYIEGAFAVCANSDETALDSCPQNFSQHLTRQLRWLRGDWQLLPYLFGRVKRADGARVQNPLAPVNKWHIFANMFRSLAPVASMLALFLSFLLSAPAYVCLVAFAPSIMYFLISVRSSALSMRPELVPEFLRQAFYIATLPTAAFNYFYSIILTLCRLIRRRKLLEWKVFAHVRGGVSFMPNLIAAIIFTSAALVYQMSAFYYVLSAAFVSGFIFDRVLSASAVKKRPRPPEFDGKLRELFCSTYDFFRENFTPENNFLPCDNFQEYGNVGWTPRTSPTNIGYALMAHVCAYEAGVIKRGELYEKTEKIISSVEKLPKWRGNLYNWIDTRNFEVLAPRYVSSVDSGNFLACLVALTPYLDGALRSRVKILAQNTQIEALFDVRRGLFRIGYNDETGEFDRNHYDLMGSEAALTYLTAVALGKIGRNAWFNLSRSGVKYGRGKMFWSWTGGMFEHLMCPLFFPYEPGTAFYESAKAVAAAQIRYGRREKLPFFGVSESQYGQIDDNGQYRYRAFGVPQIALSNQNPPVTVSPYASMLALSFAPRRVKRNLEALINAGMSGKFGLYESYDVARASVQRSFMCHHQGMTLMSVCSYLTDNSLQKKFRSLGVVRAAGLLLSECFELNARTKRPMPAPRAPSAPTAITGSGTHKTPYCNLLSSEKFAVIHTENGGGGALYDSVTLTRGAQRLFAEVDGERYGLLRGAFNFASDSSSFEYKTDAFIAKTEILLLPSGAGEVRRVEYVNTSQRTQSVRISTFAEPVLRDYAADAAHPAYSKMFVNVDYDARLKALVASRVNAERPLLLCHYIDTRGAFPVFYTGSRRNFYGRGAKTRDFGRTLDPALSGGFLAEVPPKSKLVFDVYTLCAARYDDLAATVMLTRVDGYTRRIRGHLPARVSPSAKKAASKILFGADSSVKEKIEGLNPERPIVVLDVKNENALSRLRIRLTELRALYKFGVEFNTVIIYPERHNYFLFLSERINAVLDELSYMRSLNAASTLTLVNSAENPAIAERIAASALDLSDIDFSPTEEEPAPERYPAYAEAAGAFTPDCGYKTDLTRGDTPAPYSNVIANRTFGAIVTESGGGYTYMGNSRQEKLSAWSNDPVLDPPSEYIVIAENGKRWSLTKKPFYAPGGRYTCVHSFGVSEFTTEYDGINALTRVFVSKNEQVKYYEIVLDNATDSVRDLAVGFNFDAVLGDAKINTVHALSFSKARGAVKIRNNVSGLAAYICCSRRIRSWSQRGGLLKVETDLQIAPRGAARLSFAVSGTENPSFESRGEIREYAAKKYSSLSKIQYGGAFDPKADGVGADIARLLKWLPYQTLCGRFFARTSFYQAGGAYGFRDQLQDCLALLYTDETLVREHILRCAARQFEAGDVLHWWHPPYTGVRTRVGDDRLFLPIALAEYIEFTHDFAILNERVPYLKPQKIEDGKSSRYAEFEPTARSGDILEHALKAITASCNFDARGLVKMDGGDWNDGMDGVGKKGAGGSVFTGMLLYYAAGKILPFVNDKTDRARLLDVRAKLQKAVNGAGYDGEWFLRAFKDDGTPVGSAESAECKIDILTQSWAALSGIADADRVKTALYSAQKLLVDGDARIIKLLTPPFQKQKDVGYIADYPPGVRENGGQYTHAAVWFVAALLKTGQTEKAWELFKMLDPNGRGAPYGIEPYVLAADIYAEEYAGRGGWSWYTGAAAWYYKCLVEGFLGVRFCGNKLIFEPRLPASVDAVPLKIRAESGQISVLIDNTQKRGEWRVAVGKILYNTNELILSTSLTDKKITVKRVS